MYVAKLRGCRLRSRFADLTPAGDVRFRLFNCRREAMSTLRHLDAMNKSQLAFEYNVARVRAYAQTVVELTAPGWLRNAPDDELAAVLAHLQGRSH